MSEPFEGYAAACSVCGRQWKDGKEVGRLSEWQPIETAPRSTPILLYMVARYNAAIITGQISNYAPNEGRVWDGYDYRNNIATHWMPLPAPPQMVGSVTDATPGHSGSTRRSEALKNQEQS